MKEQVVKRHPIALLIALGLTACAQLRELMPSETQAVAPPPSAPAVAEVLTDGSGMTLYVFDRDVADDLVQDTLERAVRKFHLWRPGDLRAWLFSIMHNVFVNQLKARKIAPEVEIDENALPAPIPTATSLDVIDLQRALGTLAP